ncbi:integrator complex subunit 8-like [Homarus americanus]|uniref:integrator complex subunit 8-like n=1 Tax=Homarus americanus TaxID=6706 RepID=UPI001C481FC3|nr:integrator complex subunit 8-like [Homarus americanus]XP_042208113.1 integrator complex subunit 8-like [Homarus americanus]XP_042208114.1 integrator complex subunit 8-like [Homarus americanus]
MASDTVAWFEFLLNPTLLESHLNQANPEPSPIGLIIQFIYNSIKRTDGGNSEVETMDVSTQESNKKKNALSVLALKTAAHLNWNLEIFEQKLPLHMQDALLVALLHETLEDMSSPTTHGTLDTGPLLPYQLFSVALYHRYALRALVQTKLPAKPIKVSNVPIPGQQDPTQESREVQEGILSVLERGGEVSVRILEQLLGAGEVRAPVLATFTVHTHQSSVISHNWDRCKSVADEQFKCQIHCDLGAYHFLQERYEDAFSHFSEACKLLPEIGSHPEYCQVNESKLRGYYKSCASLCGRSTPPEQRSLYDRFLYSASNGYQDLVKVLSDDNVAFEIPSYLRKNLELELEAKPEKAPQGLLLQVQTLNTIRNVLEGELWNSSYPISLSQAGKPGVQFLIQALVAKFSKLNSTHKERIRMFLLTVNLASNIREVLVPAIKVCPPLKALISQQELLTMWPQYEESRVSLIKKSPEASMTDPNNLNDIIWDLIHSYNPEVLKSAVMHYKSTVPPRPDIPKKEIPELNVKWEMPIPIYNTLMKLPQTPQRELVFLYIAKAVELTQAKSFQSALDLLEETMIHAAKLPGRETGRLCKLLTWMLLMSKIQHCLYDLPCVDNSVMSELTNEARQCLSAHSGRDGIAPWTGVNNWCILLLLNAGEWNSLLGGVSLPSHLYLLALVKPLAATAHALREKHTNKGVWYDLWDVVVGILVNSMQHKRSSSGQSTPIERHHDSVVMSRSAFLDFLENIREPSCLSIIISLLGHVLNILTQEPNSEVHIDHLAMWPLLVSDTVHIETVKDTLTWVVNHATRLYPTATHTSTALCTSWHLSKADLAYMSDQYYSALAGYLTAVFVATDFLRNDTGVDQSVLNDSIIRRMVRCCMNLNCYTQAAILCQFLESIDYSTALRCLQERNSVDAMDAYYSCLWDVSLIEFIINMHQKRGEIQRRDKALTMMGLLEVNSNNNDEIQREAAKVRKHRFLRAMAKQYLC